MKEVVVVQRNEGSETIIGTNLTVIDCDPSVTSGSIKPKLIIKEGKETIAVFIDWDYWLKKK